MHRMHAHQSSGVRGCLYFVLIGQQRHWRNYINGRLVLAFAVRIYVIIHKYLAFSHKTKLACDSNNQMTTQKCSILKFIIKSNIKFNSLNSELKR